MGVRPSGARVSGVPLQRDRPRAAARAGGESRSRRRGAVRFRGDQNRRGAGARGGRPRRERQAALPVPAARVRQHGGRPARLLPRARGLRRPGSAGDHPRRPARGATTVARRGGLRAEGRQAPQPRARAHRIVRPDPGPGRDGAGRAPGGDLDAADRAPRGVGAAGGPRPGAELQRLPAALARRASRSGLERGGRRLPQAGASLLPRDPGAERGGDATPAQRADGQRGSEQVRRAPG